MVEDLLFMLLIGLIIGVIPAAIAQRKGRSFVAWWIYGFLLFIVALPHSLLLKRSEAGIEARQLSEGMQKCPFCAEMIRQEAKVCRFCHSDLTSGSEEDYYIGS